MRAHAPLALAAALLLTACSPDEADTAVVVGRLVQAGGVVGGDGAGSLKGKVAFTSDDRTVTVDATAESGYRAHLPAGVWTVQGFAPNAQGKLVPCAAGGSSVLAVGGRETRHDVRCRSVR